MKIITLLLFCLSISMASNAQVTSLENDTILTTEIPELVKKSQETNFPYGFVREWSIDRGTTIGNAAPLSYRATFSENSSTHNKYATYLPNGMLFYQSEFLEPELIPSNIVVKTNAEFDNYTIENANLITMFNPKREIYSVKVRDQAMVQMAYFTIDGVQIPMKDLPEELLVFKY